MVRIPTHAPPTHPGEMLEEFLKPLGMPQTTLAEKIAASAEVGRSATPARFAPGPYLAYRRCGTVDGRPP
jgi:hypothetical protein